MILNVHPACCLQGDIVLPSSKSYSIRAFLIAACGGRSTIIDPSDCDDARVAIDVAKSLGATLSAGSHHVWKVSAGQKNIQVPKINVKESGTVLRLLLPILSLRGQKVKVIGEGTLIGRPNTFLLRTLRRMGVDIVGTGPKESVPINIKGGQLKGGAVKIDGTLSSQFISAIFMTAPQLNEDTRLILTGRTLVSTDYLTMTRQVLGKAGIKILQLGPREFLIKGKQKFKGLKKFSVPSDYGLAAFHLAASSLIPSNVQLRGNLKDDFIQADWRILHFLKKMGVEFNKTATNIRIHGPFQLKGGEFSLKSCPDLVPIMAILALFARTKTRLYDIAHARAKESDRISDLRRELMKIGARITESQNELVIYPQTVYKKNRLLDPHQDHRLAMAFSILGLKLGVRVKGIECVSKSYPNFVRDIKTLGAKVR